METKCECLTFWDSHHPECPTLAAEPRRDEREADELLELRLRMLDAEKMAEICDDWVQRGIIDARSALADARLNFGKPYTYPVTWAARASAAPLKQGADFTEAIHIAKSNFLTRSDVGKQYVTGYTDCRNEIVKRLESASQPQTLQTPQECNCCTCGHPRGGHDYGLHTPCFSYGCDCKKYAASLPQPSTHADVEVFADHAEECMQPIGLTTCGYPRAHIIHNNKASMSYHNFMPPSAGQMEELLVEISLIANSGSVDDFTVEGIRARLRDALYQYSAASEGESNG